MTDGISRREMVLIGGAAAALASCEGPKTAKPCEENPTDSGGYSEHHGEDPKNPPRYLNGATAEKPYKPEYIAVVIIDFERNWSVDIQHASFPIYMPTGANPENYRLGLALDLIKWVMTVDGRKLGHLKDNQFGKRDHVPYRRLYGNHKDRYDVPSFNDFRFKKQNEIFIFLKNKDILLNKDRLIRFTKFSDNMSREMDLNHTFFNALPLEGDSLGPNLKNRGKLIRVENHVTNYDGKPTVDDTFYSMNIHFRMRVKPEGSEQNYVPMIIDPDTGNGQGQGNEP